MSKRKNKLSKNNRDKPQDGEEFSDKVTVPLRKTKHQRMMPCQDEILELNGKAIKSKHNPSHNPPPTAITGAYLQL